MSSAPAVPTASTQMAPTTKIESTQEAPHGQSVSQIGHEGAGPEEAMLHTGAFNTIDMYMRMQFIALASFRWDVQQAPGTLLWSTPITPKNSHQFIRHLSQMYNTWVGGFDYNVKVCGTGFHAGALAVVRLPPNISPSSVSSPADFTAFEYLIIDPKTLEVVTEHIIDQRRVMYHYMTDTGTDSIGGHIAVYVLVQLNTSSTGSQSIAVQVLSRPSQQFNFFQIKPLESKGPEPEPDEPRELANALTVGEDCINTTATFAEEIGNFVIIPQAQTNPIASAAGCYDFAGKTIGPEDASIYPLRVINKSTFTSTEADKTLIISNLKTLPTAASVEVDTVLSRNATGGSYDPVILTSMKGEGKFAYPRAGDYNDFVIWYKFLQWIEDKQKPLTKLADESFFVFDNSTDGDKQRFSLQTYALAKLLKSKEYSSLITPQEAIIIDMYDADLDTPIRRLKLYHNGHLVTKGEADQIKLKASKYYFKYVQITRAGEPIPAPPKIFNFNEKISLWTHATTKQ